MTERLVGFMARIDCLEATDKSSRTLAQIVKNGAELVIAPVIAGLAVGIGFIALFSIFSVPSKISDNQGWPIGPVGRQAIEIARNDVMIKELLDSQEIMISYVRDQGVSHATLDCPPNRCALVIFGDHNKSDSQESVASVLVNVDSGQVFVISQR